jgi:hypothetical protein
MVNGFGGYTLIACKAYQVPQYNMDFNGSACLRFGKRKEVTDGWAKTAYGTEYELVFKAQDGEVKAKL